MLSFFYSPLEQFIVLPIFSSNLFFFSINNILITFLVIILFLIVYFLSILKPNLYLISNRWQLLFESIFLGTASLLQDNIQSNEKHKFFPIVGIIFFLILSLNLFGIVPFTFTITSELIITFAVSLLTFLGIQVISVKRHKIKFFSIFFPSGVSTTLSLLLVPIEFISFFFKPISLSIRLFANMMAGHTLLKVIAGFIWVMMNAIGIFSLTHYIPLLILVVLFILEAGVAMIQAFVFAVLFCIYINDIYNLH
jgi:ATP synthase subunit 6